ncbi:cysteine proteinase [Pluteus cervinus]|uniref:Cysteine proteinase n=1 Tax=Pluteus cervinus TaxID=181527 RepID=A0ACD3BI49_9AGAR|nr:cysteine proteinase [Pluteus cervinus]
MSFLDGLFRHPNQAQGSADPITSTKNTITFSQREPPLIVAGELDHALEECKAKVEKIARECRAKNRKFRDIEFDLERDSERCLHGLKSDGPRYTPSDVRRVSQIFDNPQFFIDGANSNDMVQGAIGDCWLVAALSTMTTSPGLVEKFCVARDEGVGVYGFIFFRNKHWVNVIIDDLLFISIPKYEELSQAEKELYHEDKDFFNKAARKGTKTLYFARSGTPGETWVPLIEKAYAKLHGDYRSLSGGRAAEAVEDLTGGVSSFISTKDIFNPDKFWNEELLKVHEDRLFGCSFRSLDTTRSGSWIPPDVNGLIGSHAYSILRAVETRGKRFLVIRNPWGKSEWTGRWSDGAKEWTREWIVILDDLEHQFGEDGQFVMEYSDFLNTWEEIDRTMLFNYNWIMSSQWLHVPVRPMPSAWGYGDVCFTINLSKPSFTVIVLSQLDDRYYNDLVGSIYWTMDFVLFKRGEKETIAESSHTTYWTRSVNAEQYLEAGEYILHVCFLSLTSQ